MSDRLSELIRAEVSGLGWVDGAHLIKKLEEEELLDPAVLQTMLADKHVKDYYTTLLGKDTLPMGKVMALNRAFEAALARFGGGGGGGGGGGSDPGDPTMFSRPAPPAPPAPPPEPPKRWYTISSMAELPDPKTDAHTLFHWCHDKGWHQPLCDLVRGEYWGERMFVLKHYVEFTFQRLLEEEKVLVYGNEVSAEYVVFNLGLVSRSVGSPKPRFGGDEVIAVIRKRPDHIARDGRKWGFMAAKPETLEGDTAFVTSAQLASMSRYHSCPAPKLAKYHTTLDEVVFDPTVPVDIQLNHLLGHEQLRRLPATYQSWSPIDLAPTIRGHIERSLKEARCDMRLAIPQYYRQTVQLLLPLYLTDDTRADLALVLSRETTTNPDTGEEGAMYVIKTWLQTDWAYCSSRLISPVHHPWLKQGIRMKSQPKKGGHAAARDPPPPPPPPPMPSTPASTPVVGGSGAGAGAGAGVSYSTAPMYHTHFPAMSTSPSVPYDSAATSATGWAPSVSMPSSAPVTVASVASAGGPSVAALLSTPPASPVPAPAPAPASASASASASAASVEDMLARAESIPVREPSVCIPWVRKTVSKEKLVEIFGEFGVIEDVDLVTRVDHHRVFVHFRYWDVMNPAVKLMRARLLLARSTESKQRESVRYGDGPKEFWEFSASRSVKPSRS